MRLFENAVVVAVVCDGGTVDEEEEVRAVHSFGDKGRSNSVIVVDAGIGEVDADG
jgi:hypothetical protein